MPEFSAATPQDASPTALFSPPLAQPRFVSPAKWVALTVAILLIGGGGVAYGGWASWVKAGRIAPGVTVQGEDLSGLSKREAKQRLKQRFGRLFIDITTDARPYRVSLSELGATPRFDAVVAKAYEFGRSGRVVPDVTHVWQSRSAGMSFALPLEWNKAILLRKVRTIAGKFNTPARNATLQVQGETVSVLPHQSGRALNVGATCAALQKRYFAGKPALEAVVRIVEPRLLAQELQGRDVKLGVYTTRYNGGDVGRTRNIHVAASEVDGTVLLPGDEFSFNRATGERTWDKGYRMAHVFERKPGKTESEVVDGLAGGVCQVSSTLFNAVRRTNANEKGLKIVERTTHSLPVTYVPRGLDATVAWPSKDFRFRNSFEHPVYLRAVAGNSRLVISVWGRVKAS